MKLFNRTPAINKRNHRRTPEICEENNRFYVSDGLDETMWFSKAADAIQAWNSGHVSRRSTPLPIKVSIL